jgi:hypothetical protein
MWIGDHQSLDIIVQRPEGAVFTVSLSASKRILSRCFQPCDPLLQTNGSSDALKTQDKVPVATRLHPVGKLPS